MPLAWSRAALIVGIVREASMSIVTVAVIIVAAALAWLVRWGCNRSAVQRLHGASFLAAGLEEPLRQSVLVGMAFACRCRISSFEKSISSPEDVLSSNRHCPALGR